MAYTKEQRSKAAKRGWKKRREKPTNLQLQDYGHTGEVGVAPTGIWDAGEDLPVTRNALAGFSADYDDMVLALDTAAYLKGQTCPALEAAFNKLGTRIAKLDWNVEGGNPARAEWFKEKHEHSIKFVDFCQGIVWGIFEGARYWQLKPARARIGMSVSWDFRGGERLKEKAGGAIHNDGVNLWEIQRPDPIKGQRPPRLLPQEDYIEFRPSGTSNPEGNTRRGLAIANVVIAWWDAFYRAKQVAKAASIPITIIEHDYKKMRPDRVGARIADNTRSVASAQTAGGVVGLDAAAKAKILAPTPGMQADMWLHIDKLASLIYQMILQNTLTTNTADSGPAGSSKVHLSEEDAAVLAVAMMIAESFNQRAVPALVRWNEGFDEVPPLNEGEEECYFWPQFPQQSDMGEAETPGEVDPVDAAIDRAVDGVAGAEAEATAFGDMEARNKAKGQSPTALAAFEPLPSAY